MVTELLATPVAADNMAKALHDMRQRMRATYGDAPDWQLRKQPGGIGEIDLLLRGLRLVHADLFDSGSDRTGELLERLEAAGHLTPDHAARLGEADKLFNDLHHALRLVMGSSALGPDTLAPAARQFVLDACDSPDTAHLDRRLTGARADVEAIFDRLMPAS